MQDYDDMIPEGTNNARILIYDGGMASFHANDRVAFAGTRITSC
jgi:hypothetical protein